MSNKPTPGELVRDLFDRIITSYSALTMFRTCRRKYFWRYIMHLVPLLLAAGDPRNYGRAWHFGLETLLDEKNVADAIDSYWGDVSKNHEAFEWRERHRAAMEGYRKRWHTDETQADFHWTVEVLEGRFNGDIVEPKTGAAHQGFAIGGKIDSAVRVHSPCRWGDTDIEPGLYLGEAKSWAKIDGNQLKRLWTNFQILLYSHYVSEAFDEPVLGVLYDVGAKAKSIGHTEAETQAEFDQRVLEQRTLANAGELGTRLKQRKGSPQETDEDFEARKAKAKSPGRLKRKAGKVAETDEDFKARRIESGLEHVQGLTPVERETDEDFRARLDLAYENPNMFHREVVAIDPRMTVDIRAEVWETLIQHEEARSRDHWGKNETACFNFNRACDYWGICKSFDSQIYIDENFRIETPHSEQDANPHLPIVQ